MNFTVSRSDFYKSLQKVINVIPAKSTVDILYNVLLITEHNTLKIIATDLEITQITWTTCRVEQEGSITVPGNLFKSTTPDKAFSVIIDISLLLLEGPGLALSVTEKGSIL